MGAAPPYKYVLNYDRSKIRAAERYQVRSDIMLRGGKRFTTVTPIPVITLGGPDTAEIVVQAVRQ